MNDFARLIKYLKPYRSTFAISVVLMIATGLLEGGMSLLLVPIFDKLSGNRMGNAASGVLDIRRFMPSGSEDTWHIIALFLVGLTLAKGVTEYFSSFSMSHIGQHVIADVRSALYDHIIHQPATFSRNARRMS
ncbi:MAG: hypothetical protein IPO77_06885 [Acidobacteria bacterium]|nr:hypothetical protein [Acidobacteriota bacterium]